MNVTLVIQMKPQQRRKPKMQVLLLFGGEAEKGS
jgi:hypothetical protein